MIPSSIMSSMSPKAGDGQITTTTLAKGSVLNASFYFITSCKCTNNEYQDSHLFTKEHDLHRTRRKPLEPFFSRLGINRLQPVIVEAAMQLETQIRGFQGTNSVIRLDHAFSAYAGDIVAMMCLNTNDSRDRFLSRPDFSPDWYGHHDGTTRFAKDVLMRIQV